MIKSKKVKTLLFTTCLSLSLSLLAPLSAYAATYTAVSGDSLYKISQLFGTTITNLMNDNNLKSTSLNIGQVLTVPCDTYTVQKGDTLYIISQKFKVSLDALRRVNNIYTNNINIGQVLNIPQTASSTDSTSNTASEVPNYTASDLDLLSRLIMAEAQGEPYNAKVAVGAVVMNRVQSDLWPNTIKGVIYQNINGYNQFTPVVNGWIDKPANDECLKAAKEALSGTDPTKGAMFYYDNTTTNPWILSKPVAIEIGNMVFAY